MNSTNKNLAAEIREDESNALSIIAILLSGFTIAVILYFGLPLFF